MAIRFIMLGDIVGKPGRRVVHQHLLALRREYNADLIVANAENIAGGSGITPQLFDRLIHYGLDGVTLGDHVYRQKAIVPALESAANLIRPANLPKGAAGRGWMMLTPPSSSQDVCIVTLLGRLLMPTMAADDPFAAADRILAELPSGAIVIVEIHAEATSEKVALGHYLDGRVAAVIGTHTHIPTADAKILPGGTAYITDLGMCGPYDSVLGRRKDRVLHHMTTAMPTPFSVADGDIRLCGVLIEVGDDGRAVRCERLEMPADLSRAPFHGAADDDED